MLLRIEEIKEEGLALEFEETADSFPVLAEMSEAGECRFPAPLRTRLRAVRAGHLVEVEGTVETTVDLPCGRCLKRFVAPLAGHFALTFTRQLPEAAAEAEEEVELGPDELGLVPFQGEEIDLLETVQEQVVLALPLRPLCQDECQGLCPQCGADLNAGDCGCERPVFSVKFAALKDFKVKRK